MALPSKHENKVTLQMVDEGGPGAALHIYIDGDYTHGAGRMASFMLAGITLALAEQGDMNSGRRYPEEVKAMIAHHLRNDDDTQESESILGTDKS